MSREDAKRKWTRRAAVLSATALPLAGCSLKPYGLGWNDWKNLFGPALGLSSAPGISRDQAAQIPFATIGFRVGDSGEGLLLLAEKSQTGSLWTSIKRQAILTTKGRIRQTAGFPWNLTDTNFVEEDPVGTSRLLADSQGLFDRICDYADIHNFQIRIASRFKIQSNETITILETEMNTVRVVESCNCKMLNWDFENYYWIDRQSGYVWRTVQNVHPNLKPFTVEVLRPEA